jgi:ADP-heptose:LPS heptosyltransferase
MDALEAERNFFIYAAGTAEDRAYVEEVAGKRRRGGLLNLAGQTSLLELAALAGESDLFITLDTGAAHVAGNGGVGKLVVIFTCTEPEGIEDSVPQARMVSSREPCCPCRKHPEDCPEPACQRNVTVEMVLAAAREALAGGRMAG